MQLVVTVRCTSSNKSGFRDQEMVAQIEAAAREIHAEGQPVTRDAILQRTGIAKRTLSRHVHAREVMKRVVVDYQGRQQD